MRRSLPVWTRDGKKFAYRVQTTADPTEYEIRTGILRTREIKTLHKRRDPIRDLYWSPDGKRLGFVAGVLFYSMIRAGLLSGSAFPPLDAVQQDEDFFAASVFWGIASGFSFEWVFERMRGTTEGTR